TPSTWDTRSVMDPPQTMLNPPNLFLDNYAWHVPAERSWFSTEYLLWWVRSGATPPLVVTGSEADAFPGALDQPGTRILFGKNGISHDELNGLRLKVGTWLDDEGRWGLEAT